MATSFRIKVPCSAVILGDLNGGVDSPQLAAAFSPELAFSFTKAQSAGISLVLGEKKYQISGKKVTPKPSEQAKIVIDFCQFCLRQFPQLTKEGLIVEGRESSFDHPEAVIVGLIKGLDEILRLKLTTKQILEASLFFETDCQPKLNFGALVSSLSGGVNYSFFSAQKTITQALYLDNFCFLGISLKKKPNQDFAKTLRLTAKKQPQNSSLTREKISFLAQESRKAVQKQDYPLLGSYLNRSQKLNSDLGVEFLPSHNICVLAHLMGAYGAKYCLGAGKGLVVALVANQNREKFKNKLLSQPEVEDIWEVTDKKLRLG
jgi:mRNA-degrading endonuclease YafQ of YafQ-DinJ toxin-antitoxin module